MRKTNLSLQTFRATLKVCLLLKYLGLSSGTFLIVRWRMTSGVVLTSTTRSTVSTITSWEPGRSPSSSFTARNVRMKIWCQIHKNSFSSWAQHSRVLVTGKPFQQGDQIGRIFNVWLLFSWVFLKFHLNKQFRNTLCCTYFNFQKQFDATIFDFQF